MTQSTKSTKSRTLPKYIHIFRAGGTYEKRKVHAKPTLKEMQDIVGGYIEPVSVRFEKYIRIMVVNEEGKLRGLTVNIAASKIAGSLIVGDVLILEGYRV